MAKRGNWAPDDAQVALEAASHALSRAAVATGDALGAAAVLVDPELPPIVAGVRTALQDAADALLLASRALAAIHPSLLTVDQAAVRLNLGRTATYRLVMDGSIRSHLIGRRRLVPDRAIGEYIDGLRDGSVV